MVSCRDLVTTTDHHDQDTDSVQVETHLMHERTSKQSHGLLIWRYKQGPALSASTFQHACSIKHRAMGLNVAWAGLATSVLEALTRI